MITQWTSNDTNTVFTAQGRRGKYIITFVKFTDSGNQVWELCQHYCAFSMPWRTDCSSLVGAKRIANCRDDLP